MKLIIGLGNPGKEYAWTRHNVGFMVIDQIIKDLKLSELKLEEKRKAETTTSGEGRDKILLAKPQTFMNLSGEAVGALLRFYKIRPQNLIVIVDDVNLELGDVRVRERGSAGGHNGLKSIIQVLGTNEFKRIRIGVDWDKRMPMDKYVLGKFKIGERRLIAPAIKKAATLATES